MLVAQRSRRAVATRKCAPMHGLKSLMSPRRPRRRTDGIRVTCYLTSEGAVERTFFFGFFLIRVLTSYLTLTVVL